MKKESKQILRLTFLLLFFLSTVFSSHSPHKTQRFTSSDDSTELLVAALNQTISKVNLSSSNFSDLLNRLGSNLSHRDRCAFDDCLQLLDDTVFDLTAAISELRSHSPEIHNVKMLLSATMTNTRTCLDGFASSDDEEEDDLNYNNNKTYGVAESLKESLFDISSHVRNSLDMLEDIPGNIPGKLEEDVGFPMWVSGSDRNLLQDPVDETKVDLVVAQNGTGNYTTIGEAVSAAPNSSDTRFVIYIKSGVYFENIEILREKTMIMFVGDGIGLTVIKANRSYGDGWTAYFSATVGVRGSGFIAKDLSFVNDAGPAKHQAVALRSSSDLSAFYRCSFESYQDTIYAHSHKQFYRECDIYGTVDFIFGDASVVFQNCSLFARRPNPNQRIIYTAQGREDSRLPTGISIIHCKILAAPELIPVQANFKAYLGRPWQLYSRTVIMKSFIDDLVDPAGWFKWKNDFALETLYYGEYMNEGPGSNLTNRVQWPGFKRIETVEEATEFSVGPFIEGNKWLNSTGIPFTLDL
ncbi:PREDICTED: probable pectinesterase/pectinesterase inhibitor 40 [Camelina sativa]|uniref:Pectinesterase n=1 Tax=Camelina sativa TaxID=90675 RepID=A0ABM0T8T0_CAMSA|nr:PREDICTED: probable pectinesterase/pectinesterase inhibitor 40 [Camelina sativa]